MATKKTAYLTLVAVLVFGFAAGMVIDHFIAPKRYQGDWHGRRGADRAVTELTHELQLNEQQQQKLEELLEEVKAKHDSIQKENWPKFNNIKEYFDSEFSKILNEEQQARFRELEKKHRPGKNKNSDRKKSNINNKEE
jgi:uncharacterized membrane-anchored protein YjiN (DUF445 family)